MKSEARIVVALVAALVSGMLAVHLGAQRGQGGQQPQRDQPPPPTGTSIIQGRLLDATTGAPVRRAYVRAISTGDVRVQRATNTDADGRYQVTTLPAGTYTVTASKSGYVDMSYGQTRPFEQAKPVTLGDHQTRDRIDLTLPRGGVITGRVLDEFGEPIADASVMPIRLLYTANGKRAQPSGRGSLTNDIGEFRLFGLAPGTYFISTQVRAQNVAIPSASALAPVEASDGYAPTYYPSAASVAEAQSLTVGAGETLSDITVSLTPTRLSRVSGYVYDSQGSGRGGNVAAIEAGDTGMMAIGVGTFGGPVAPDGSFSINNLPPGRYLLRANLGNGPGGRRNGPPEIAVAPIIVSGEDLSGVMLQPLAPITLDGRLIVDASAATTLQARNLRVIAGPAMPGSPLAMPNQQSPATVNNDLTFQLSVYPDTPVIARLNNVPAGWMVRAVHLNGADVTDGFTLRNETSGHLDIELSNRAPSLSGQAIDGTGQPATNYTVIAFPADRSLWGSVLVNQSALLHVSDGNPFTIQSLRPGSYALAASEQIDEQRWLDPEFLERAARVATRVDLMEGDTKTVTLKLATW
ncbi:MAG: carboxypeptidase regulatory-like domain-containing protein [Acidobacteriaceae bacterium]|jgi:hypothetical protein|nr:carboxypeptidase regulatory-like domain-containing protein [Acidobacteriaceae bacterium]